MKTVTFKKDYVGFESCSDIERDILEHWNENFNPAAKAYESGEFQGTVTVTITYENLNDLPHMRTEEKYD